MAEVFQAVRQPMDHMGLFVKFGVLLPKTSVASSDTSRIPLAADVRTSMRTSAKMWFFDKGVKQGAKSDEAGGKGHGVNPPLQQGQDRVYILRMVYTRKGAFCKHHAQGYSIFK